VDARFLAASDWIGDGVDEVSFKMENDRGETEWDDSTSCSRVWQASTFNYSRYLLFEMACRCWSSTISADRGAASQGDMGILLTDSGALFLVSLDLSFISPPAETAHIQVLLAVEIDGPQSGPGINRIVHFWVSSFGICPSPYRQFSLNAITFKKPHICVLM
jgi:hypothetical protein